MTIYSPSNLARRAAAEDKHRAEWLRTCTNKIVEVAGEDLRDSAYADAANYLEARTLDDDPVAAAVLILEEWQ